MKKISTLCAFLFLSAVFSSAQAQDIPAHDVRMGFSGWPPELTVEAVGRVKNFVSHHANITLVHMDNGIPWTEALASTDYPRHLQEDWKFRKAHLPAGMPVYLALTPMNFGRDSLAPAWTENGDNQDLDDTWENRAFDDPAVVSAYTAYVLNAIDYFNPSYVAIGIEVNIMATKAPEKFPAYLFLNREVYKAVKTRYPQMPVFASIQYEYLRGIEESARESLEKQAPAVKQLLENSDFLALSTYQYGYRQNNPMTADYFSAAEAFGKQIAVSESGAMSQTQRIYWMKFNADQDVQYDFMEGLLRQAVEKKFPMVINFVSIDYDKMLNDFPFAMREIAKAWAYSGLMTSNGEKKKALEIWDKYLLKARFPNTDPR